MTELPIMYKDARKDLRKRISNIINERNLIHLKHIRPKTPSARERQTKVSILVSPFTDYQEPYVSPTEIRRWAKENNYQPDCVQTQRKAIKAIAGGLGQIGRNEVLINIMGAFAQDKFMLGRPKSMYSPVRVYMGEYVQKLADPENQFYSTPQEVQNTLHCMFMNRASISSVFQGNNDLLEQSLYTLNSSIESWRKYSQFS